MDINFTPGVAIADQLLPLFDPDHDGVITDREVTAYAEAIKRDLAVRIDQRQVELKFVACHIPAPIKLRSGEGIIQVEFTAVPGELASGTHTLSLENRHLPAVSVYLVNAAKPTSESIQITKQERNENQSRGEIEFTYQRPQSSIKTIGIVAALGVAFVGVIARVRRARKLRS